MRFQFPLLDPKQPTSKIQPLIAIIWALAPLSVPLVGLSNEKILGPRNRPGGHTGPRTQNHPYFISPEFFLFIRSHCVPLSSYRIRRGPPSMVATPKTFCFAIEIFFFFLLLTFYIFEYSLFVHSGRKILQCISICDILVS